MTEKILEVFYDTNALPYKDSAREVHYPIVGSAFTGASNTTQIRFYVRDIGGVADVGWVAVTKLPSGKKLYKVLDVESPTTSEGYAYLNLSSEYTQEKGDIYIALNGYQGGVEVTYDDESGLYGVEGNPVIMATGNIKIAVAYTPYVDQGYGTTSILDVQDMLELIYNKLNIANGIVVVENINTENVTSYNEGQLVYSKTARTSDNVHFFQVRKHDYPPRNKYWQSISFEQILNYINEINFNEGGKLDLTQGASILINNDEYGYYELYYDSTNGGIKLDLVNRTTSTHTNIISMNTSGAITFNGTLANVYKKTETNTLLNGKVDRLTTSGLYAYTHTGSSQGEIEINVGAVGGTLPVRNANGQIIVPLTPTENNHATSKKYIDDNLNLKADKSTTYTKTEVNNLIDSVKSGEVVLVNITTYPTLQSFLASIGVEGTIYLYPINTIDLSEGYYRYVWETISGSSQWVNLGTTEIDLSDYYTKSETDTLLSAKADKSTTLSGYGITNAYTKTETDTLLGAKQDTLVSGTNIKTINNTSILGSGNYAFDTELSELSTNAVENQVVSKEFREINYELAIIREELFEVVLSEIDYSVDYAMTYVVPDTLTDTDGTHRVVYSETQLKTISGNSVVDNQILNNFNVIPSWARASSYWGGLTPTLSSTNKTLTLNGTTTSSANNLGTGANVLTTGNKYLYVLTLVSGSVDYSNKTTSNAPKGYDINFRPATNNQNPPLKAGDVYARIFEGNSSNSTYNTIDNGVVFNNCVFMWQLIDLTQMFPSNTPTSTDDVRIKWLLSRGYIAYNTGSLLSTSVSGLESVGLNQWDESTSTGKLNGATGVLAPSDANLCSADFIKVIPNATYHFSIPNNNTTVVKICGYDKNKNFVSSYIGQSGKWAIQEGNYVLVYPTFTIPSNIEHIRFSIGTGYGTTYNHDICINISNANVNGTYKPYSKHTLTLPTTELKSARSVHDYLEIVEGNIIEGEQRYDIVKHTLVGTRAYASGDESDTSVITDLTNTNYALASGSQTETTIATDLTFEQVSLLIQQGGTLNTNFTNVPPNTTTKFVVKKAVGE